MYCQKTSFAAGFHALTKSRSLLQADSVEKVVRRPESETQLAKPVKLQANFTIRRRRAWQNIWNVFHLSLSLAAVVVYWLEVFVTGYLYYLIWLNISIL